MCCFSRPVRLVSGTRIFTRAEGEGRQLLVYAMQLSVDEDLAMVLPLPVVPASPEDAVAFVDMSACASFFDDLDAIFADEEISRFAPGAISAAPPPRARLVVHDVGDFEASFVPTLGDFDRLDPRFRLPNGVWDALPEYADWGFAVFKLRQAPPIPSPLAPTGAATSDAPGVLSKVGALFGFGSSDATAPKTPSPGAGVRKQHPMALTFPRRDRASLFFPTVHVHDGQVHPTARFDHALYCQLEERDSAAAEDGWTRSTLPADAVAKRAHPWLRTDRHAFKKTLTGEHRNRDVKVRASIQR